MDNGDFFIEKQINQKRLQLFVWHDLPLKEGNYTIYAVAKNIKEAKQMAIRKAPLNIQKKLEKQLNLPDSIVVKFDHPSSFIYKS